MPAKCLPFCNPGCRIRHHSLLLALNNLPVSSSSEQRDEVFTLASKFFRRNRSDADISDSENPFQYPLLHWACVLAKPEVVEYLVSELQQPVCLQSHYKKETALHRTVLNLHNGMGMFERKLQIYQVLKMFKILLELLHDALPCRDDNGDTPLHVCATYIADKIPTPSELLTGSDKHIAAEEGKLFSSYLRLMAKAVLIKPNSDAASVFDMQNSEGNTILHILCGAKHPDVGQLASAFWKHTSKWDARNGAGLTARDIAKAGGVIVLNLQTVKKGEAGHVRRPSSSDQESPIVSKLPRTTKNVTLCNGINSHKENIPIRNGITESNATNISLHQGEASLVPSSDSSANSAVEESCFDANSAVDTARIIQPCDAQTENQPSKNTVKEKRMSFPGVRHYKPASECDVPSMSSPYNQVLTARFRAPPVHKMINRAAKRKGTIFLRDPPPTPPPKRRPGLPSMALQRTISQSMPSFAETKTAALPASDAKSPSYIENASENVQEDCQALSNEAKHTDDRNTLNFDNGGKHTVKPFEVPGARKKPAAGNEAAETEPVEEQCQPSPSSFSSSPVSSPAPSLPHLPSEELFPVTIKSSRRVSLSSSPGTSVSNCESPSLSTTTTLQHNLPRTSSHSLPLPVSVKGNQSVANEFHRRKSTGSQTQAKSPPIVNKQRHSHTTGMPMKDSSAIARRRSSVSPTKVHQSSNYVTVGKESALPSEQAGSPTSLIAMYPAVSVQTFSHGAEKNFSPANSATDSHDPTVDEHNLCSVEKQGNERLVAQGHHAISTTKDQSMLPSSNHHVVPAARLEKPPTTSGMNPVSTAICSPRKQSSCSADTNNEQSSIQQQIQQKQLDAKLLQTDTPDIQRVSSPVTVTSIVVVSMTDKAGVQSESKDENVLPMVHIIPVKKYDLPVTSKDVPIKDNAATTDGGIELGSADSVEITSLENAVAVDPCLDAAAGFAAEDTADNTEVDSTLQLKPHEQTLPSVSVVNVVDNDKSPPAESNSNRDGTDCSSRSTSPSTECHRPPSAGPRIKFTNSKLPDAIATTTTVTDVVKAGLETGSRLPGMSHDAATNCSHLCPPEINAEDNTEASANLTSTNAKESTDVVISHNLDASKVTISTSTAPSLVSPPSATITTVSSSSSFALLAGNAKNPNPTASSVTAMPATSKQSLGTAKPSLCLNIKKENVTLEPVPVLELMYAGDLSEDSASTCSSRPLPKKHSLGSVNGRVSSFNLQENDCMITDVIAPTGSKEKTQSATTSQSAEGSVISNLQHLVTAVSEELHREIAAGGCSGPIYSKPSALVTQTLETSSGVKSAVQQKAGSDEATNSYLAKVQDIYRWLEEESTNYETGASGQSGTPKSSYAAAIQKGMPISDFPILDDVRSMNGRRLDQSSCNVRTSPPSLEPVSPATTPSDPCARNASSTDSNMYIRNSSGVTLCSTVSSASMQHMPISSGNQRSGLPATANYPQVNQPSFARQNFAISRSMLHQSFLVDRTPEAQVSPVIVAACSVAPRRKSSDNGVLHQSWQGSVPNCLQMPTNQIVSAPVRGTGNTLVNALVPNRVLANEHQAVTTPAGASIQQTPLALNGLSSWNGLSYPNQVAVYPGNGSAGQMSVCPTSSTSQPTFRQYAGAVTQPRFNGSVGAQTQETEVMNKLENLLVKGKQRQATFDRHLELIAQQKAKEQQECKDLHQQMDILKRSVNNIVSQLVRKRETVHALRTREDSVNAEKRKLTAYVDKVSTALNLLRE